MSQEMHLSMQKHCDINARPVSGAVTLPQTHTKTIGEDMEYGHKTCENVNKYNKMMAVGEQKILL